MWYATIFALALFALQLATGTELIFSLCCFFFVLVATVAFNVAGGLSRPSGSYVFFFATLGAIVGLISKVIFLEPGQSRLQAPLPTIESYLGGMVTMLIAAYLARRFSLREGLLQNVVSDGNMRLAMIGCVVFGILYSVVAHIANASGAQTVLTPFFRAQNQLNHFLEVAIVLGVTYQIRVSKGKSSINLTVLIAWAAIYFQSVFIGYSKEGLFSPFVCWIAAAAVLGYNFRPYQLITATALFIFLFVYMVPFCQYGRNFRDDTRSLAADIEISTSIFADLPNIRRSVTEDELNSATIENATTYYSTSHGLVDRLQMLSIDGALHVVTDQLGPEGLTPMWAYLSNAVPRVIWKDKPDILQANIYGHELGLLAPEDENTSISVSPIGEAYRLLGWAGIFLLAPVVWFVLFVVVDSLCGDLRKSPWGILVFAGFAHQANEGGLAGPVYVVTFGVVGLLFVSFFTGYVLPLLASLVTPPRRPEFIARQAARSPLSVRR